jgi:proteasome lid subunit RPN8/RPN11
MARTTTNGVNIPPPAQSAATLNASHQTIHTIHTIDSTQAVPISALTSSRLPDSMDESFSATQISCTSINSSVNVITAVGASFHDDVDIPSLSLSKSCHDTRLMEQNQLDRKDKNIDKPIRQRNIVKVQDVNSHDKSNRGSNEPELDCVFISKSYISNSVVPSQSEMRSKSRTKSRSKPLSNTWSNASNSSNIWSSSSPTTMHPLAFIPCRKYRRVQSQPFAVYVHVNAMFRMNVHAHLVGEEIIGLLGGTLKFVKKKRSIDSKKRTKTLNCHASSTDGHCRDNEKTEAEANDLHVDDDDENGVDDEFVAVHSQSEFMRVLQIKEAFPCQSLNTNDNSVNVEMCPISQIQALESMASKGMQCVGWYHSHPNFKNEPSATDVINQARYQNLFAKKCSDSKVNGYNDNCGIGVCSPFALDESLQNDHQHRKQHHGNLGEKDQPHRNNNTQESEIVCKVKHMHPFQHSTFWNHDHQSPFVGAIINPYQCKSKSTESSTKWFISIESGSNNPKRAGNRNRHGTRMNTGFHNITERYDMRHRGLDDDFHNVDVKHDRFGDINRYPSRGKNHQNETRSSDSHQLDCDKQVHDGPVDSVDNCHRKEVDNDKLLNNFVDENDSVVTCNSTPWELKVKYYGRVQQKECSCSVELIRNLLNSAGIGLNMIDQHSNTADVAKLGGTCTTITSTSSDSISALFLEPDVPINNDINIRQTLHNVVDDKIAIVRRNLDEKSSIHAADQIGQLNYRHSLVNLSLPWIPGKSPLKKHALPDSTTVLSALPCTLNRGGHQTPSFQYAPHDVDMAGTSKFALKEPMNMDTVGVKSEHPQIIGIKKVCIEDPIPMNAGYVHKMQPSNEKHTESQHESCESLLPRMDNHCNNISNNHLSAVESVGTHEVTAFRQLDYESDDCIRCSSDYWLTQSSNASVLECFDVHHEDEQSVALNDNILPKNTISSKQMNQTTSSVPIIPITPLTSSSLNMCHTSVHFTLKSFLQLFPVRTHLDKFLAALMHTMRCLANRNPFQNRMVRHRLKLHIGHHVSNTQLQQLDHIANIANHEADFKGIEGFSGQSHSRSGENRSSNINQKIACNCNRCSMEVLRSLANHDKNARILFRIRVMCEKYFRSVNADCSNQD